MSQTKDKIIDRDFPGTVYAQRKEIQPSNVAIAIDQDGDAEAIVIDTAGRMFRGWWQYKTPQKEAGWIWQQLPPLPPLDCNEN